jgi:hypothetical protein
MRCCPSIPVQCSSLSAHFIASVDVSAMAASMVRDYRDRRPWRDAPLIAPIVAMVWLERDGGIREVIYCAHSDAAPVATRSQPVSMA